MKVSDLILELQEFHEEHGDLGVLVRVNAPPGGGTLRPIRGEPAVTKGSVISSRADDEPICVVEL